MQTVDRLGVHIEQCQGCRGIFLDRGELEQIAHAEQAHYATAAPPPHRGGYRDSPPPHRGGYRDSPPPYGGHGHNQRRRRSFLEGLFD